MKNELWFKDLQFQLKAQMAAQPTGSNFILVYRPHIKQLSKLPKKITYRPIEDYNEISDWVLYEFSW